MRALAAAAARRARHAAGNGGQACVGLATVAARPGAAGGHGARPRSFLTSALPRAAAAGGGGDGGDGGGSGGGGGGTVAALAAFGAGAVGANLLMRPKQAAPPASEAPAPAQATPTPSVPTPPPPPPPASAAAEQKQLASPAAESVADDGGHHVVNWSGTHEATPRVWAAPETEAELVAAIASAHAAGSRLRCVGSALSPNGLAFDDGGMLSLALMDRVLAIDVPGRTVTVQGGARVREVVEALRPHGLTLPVYASIREQSIGGYVQAGVHGTGATVAPADHYVTALRLVTPAAGVLDLDDEGEHGGPGGLFRLARVGLGALGAVSAATLRCDRATWLVERTFVVTREEAVANHDAWLKAHRHVRYMWIPHTDAVVVVALDEAEPGAPPPAGPPAADDAARCAPLQALVPAALALRGVSNPPDDLGGLTPMLLRQWLLNAAPLDAAWVATVNAAEAALWRLSQGGRAGWSDQMLGFDCAGPQWVLEVAMPAGTLDSPSGADMQFMADLLAEIEDPAAPIPAHAPIEQRWTASSASDLSPAAGPPGGLHSWVGIIMYLPDDDDGPALRARVDAAFAAYASVVEGRLGPAYGATEHWAKIEPGRLDLGAARMRLAARFPASRFAAARAALDPKNVMGNALVDAVFPHPLVPAAGGAGGEGGEVTAAAPAETAAAGGGGGALAVPPPA